MRPQACKGGFLTMAVAVFNDFLKEFEQPITQFVSTSVQNLATYMDTPLRTAATYVRRPLRHRDPPRHHSRAGHGLRLARRCAWRSSSPSPRTHRPSRHVTGAVLRMSAERDRQRDQRAQGSTCDPVSPFDQLLSKGIEVAQKIYDQSGLTDIAPALIAGILWSSRPSAGSCSLP